MRKDRVSTDDGRFGGIYIWKDRARPDRSLFQRRLNAPQRGLLKGICQTNQA